LTGHLKERTAEELQTLYDHYGMLSEMHADNGRSRYHRIFYAIFGEIERRAHGVDSFSYQNHTRYVWIDDD
jgi:hypothetical protein